MATIGRWLARKLDVNVEYVERAAALAKCDLITGMVGEFPELQGTMGYYYATAEGEPAEVARAIGEHYKPRFAGDELPATPEGKVLAVADKLDALAGIFTLGKKPSGSSDPFGLRRAALGIVRILIEGGLDTELPALIAKAAKAQPKGKLDATETAAELQSFIVDRLRHYFLDRDSGLDTGTFDAVAVREPDSLLDFDRRIAAVQTFARLDQAQSLASANKRIANMLRQAGDPEGLRVDEKLLEDAAEVALYNAQKNAQKKVGPMLKSRAYAEVLNTLADLREPVDRFFDDVMVMADDERVRDNRLALLSELRALFLDVADISRLSIA